MSIRVWSSLVIDDRTDAAQRASKPAVAFERELQFFLLLSEATKKISRPLSWVKCFVAEHKNTNIFSSDAKRCSQSIE